MMLNVGNAREFVSSCLGAQGVETFVALPASGCVSFVWRLPYSSLDREREAEDWPQNACKL